MNSKCIIDGEKLYVANIDGLWTLYDLCRSVNWGSITILISSTVDSSVSSGNL